MIGSYTEFKTVSCLGSSIPTLSAESSLVRRCDVHLHQAALGLLGDCPQYQVEEVTTRATVRRSWGVERDIDLKSCKPTVNFTPTPFIHADPIYYGPFY